MGRGVLAQTEEELGVGRLCLIGRYLHGLCLLLQGEDDSVHGLSDDRALLVGSTGEQAVDNVLSGKEPQVVESEYLADLVKLRRRKLRQRQPRS